MGTAVSLGARKHCSIYMIYDTSLLYPNPIDIFQDSTRCTHDVADVTSEIFLNCGESVAIYQHFPCSDMALPDADSLKSNGKDIQFLLHDFAKFR